MTSGSVETTPYFHHGKVSTSRQPALKKRGAYPSVSSAPASIESWSDVSLLSSSDVALPPCVAFSFLASFSSDSTLSLAIIGGLEGGPCETFCLMVSNRAFISKCAVVSQSAQTTQNCFVRSMLHFFYFARKIPEPDRTCRHWHHGLLNLLRPLCFSGVYFAINVIDNAKRMCAKLIFYNAHVHRTKRI